MMASQQFCRTWWQPAMLAVLLSVACSGSTGTAPASPSTPSDPVLAAALTVTMNPASVEPVAYVALVPGTIAGGTTATIVNTASGARRSTAVLNGGFDPVAVPANFGDTLSISVATSTGAVVIADVVASARPPHVIRVSPAKSQVDVPVNTNLTVVFSEPMNAATVTPASLQLSVGGTSIPGSVTTDPATPWLATFTPYHPLATTATYTFTVGGGISDPAGHAIDAPVTTSFVTAADAVPVASITISPIVTLLLPAEQVQLSGVATDAAGNTLPGRSFIWASNDPAVATVDANGLVTAVQNGGAVSITATADGRTGAATVRVGDCSNPLDPNICPPFPIIGTRTITGTIRQLMPDGSLRPVPNALYGAWIDTRVAGFPTGLRQADSTGAFRIDSVPDAHVSITAAGLGGFSQPCMAVGNTIGQNDVVNVTVVDAANPLPLLAITAPAITGTIYRMVDGLRVPVAGAVVLIEAWELDLVVATTIADSQGRYSLCGLQLSLGNEVGLGFVSAVAPGNSGVESLWTTITVSGAGIFDIVVP
jgi:hypothetical protein